MMLVPAAVNEIINITASFLKSALCIVLKRENLLFNFIELVHIICDFINLLVMVRLMSESQ